MTDNQPLTSGEIATIRKNYNFYYYWIFRIFSAAMERPPLDPDDYLHAHLLLCVIEELVKTLKSEGGDESCQSSAESIDLARRFIRSYRRLDPTAKGGSRIANRCAAIIDRGLNSTRQRTDYLSPDEVRDIVNKQ